MRLSRSLKLGFSQDILAKMPVIASVIPEMTREYGSSPHTSKHVGKQKDNVRNVLSEIKLKCTFIPHLVDETVRLCTQSHLCSGILLELRIAFTNTTPHALRLRQCIPNCQSHIQPGDDDDLSWRSIIQMFIENICHSHNLLYFLV